MFEVSPRLNFMKLFFDNRPRAFAEIKGEGKYSGITGTVYFYESATGGILIEAEVFGLPDAGRLAPPVFYAFHIHEIGNCSAHYTHTGNHYNPQNRNHPMHAGDLPPLLSGNGYAWLSFYAPQLELYEIVGKSIIIHQNADDFTTQPSGNAGEKIACGVIKSI